MGRKKAEKDPNAPPTASTPRGIQIDLPSEVTERIGRFCEARLWLKRSAVTERVRHDATAAATAAVNSDEYLASLFS